MGNSIQDVHNVTAFYIRHQSCETAQCYDPVCPLCIEGKQDFMIKAGFESALFICQVSFDRSTNSQCLHSRFN
jgi:hypothetical protein